MSQPVPSQELAHSNNHGVPYSDAISTLVADGSEDVENLPGEERERSAGDLKSTENEEDWEDDDDMEEAEGTETIKKPKNFSDLPIGKVSISIPNIPRTTPKKILTKVPRTPPKDLERHAPWLKSNSR